MRTPPTNGQHGHAGRREATERRILESTVELLASGLRWHELGIRQIADRAEISRTAFYDFFGSKNEILEHMVRRVHGELGSSLLASSTWRADDARSPVLDLTAVRQLLRTIDAFNQSHGRIYRAFLDAARQDPEIDALWDDLVGAYVAVVTRAIDAVRLTHRSAPRSPGSDALAWVLVLMTERTVLLLGRDAIAAGRTDLLESLALVWERSVFGAVGEPHAPTA